MEGLPVTDGVELSEDGWRWYSPCVDGCGVRVVTTVEYVGKGRCVDCGRAYWSAPPTHLRAREVDYTLPLGQPGQSWPGKLDPDRLNAPLRRTRHNGPRRDDHAS